MREVEIIRAVKIAFGVALLVSGVYLLTANGHLLGQDQEYYYRIARSIAHERTFAIEPLVFGNTELAGARGRDGRFYAQYAPGLPVALTPLVLLGDKLRGSISGFTANYPWIHSIDNDVAARIVASYFNIPVTATTAGLLTALALQLGYSSFAAVFAGFSFALSTFAWGQSRIVYPEPLQGLLLLAASLLLFRASGGRVFIGGCALALAILVKITSLLAVPALLLLPDARGLPFWRRWASGAAIVVPVLLALAAYGWYNYIRFGSLTALGYGNWGREASFSGNAPGNPLTGFFGLLVSTGRGVVWYAPLVIVALASGRRFYFEQRQLTVALTVLIATWLAVHSSYKGWEGGWGWGPRYLLPVLPFALIPLGVALRSRVGQLTCAGLFVAGALTQLPGVLVDFMAAGHEGMRIFEESVQERSQAAFHAWRDFNIYGSEIVRHSALLVRGQLDLAWLTFRNTPLPIVTFTIVTLCVLGGLALLVPQLLADVRKCKDPSRATPG